MKLLEAIFAKRPISLREHVRALGIIVDHQGAAIAELRRQVGELQDARRHERDATGWADK